MADKSSSPKGGGDGKGKKGMPSIPKEIKEGIEKQSLRIHEEKFSRMSWGTRMVLSILVDIISIPLGLIPGLGFFVALVVSWVAKILWGNTGWINLWEAAMQFALPFWIGGIITAVIPTVTIAGLIERPARTKKTRRPAGTKKYRVRPVVKEFFYNPRGLAEKKILKVRKFFSRFRLRSGVKRKFKKFDT